MMLLDTSLDILRTVTKYELCNAGDVHRDSTEEVVVATEADEALWCNGALKATEDKDRRRVWNEEAYQSKESWVGFS
jgi:hypothetical protein